MTQVKLLIICLISLTKLVHEKSHISASIENSICVNSECEMWFPTYVVLVVLGLLMTCQAHPKNYLIETKDAGIIFTLSKVDYIHC
jgi:hypothetical protein